MMPLVMMLIIFVGILVPIIFGWGHVLSSDFNQRFPPIDDDEFIARCSPGVSRDVALRVRRIVARQLGVEYERIYPSSRFVDDLGAD